MARKGYSPQEQRLFQNGPFGGNMDPWAEDDHYFQTIHTEIISVLIETLQQPLFDLGYVPGREASLQITEGREPDIYIQTINQIKPAVEWNYDLAAAEILAEPGVRVEEEGVLSALHIRSADSGDLVTICEIVSPGNKRTIDQIRAYQERRSRLFLERGVNVVEIDLTRSTKRLVNNPVTSINPYHIAVFLPGDTVRILEVKWNQVLPRLALPLRGEVVPVDLQQTYQRAYSRATTAWHIEHDGHYEESYLPLAVGLSDVEREQALSKVRAWQAEVMRLRSQN